MSNYLEKDTFRMITNEALGGLHAGKEMKERILEAATHPEKRSRTSGRIPAFAFSAAVMVICMVLALPLLMKKPVEKAVTVSEPRTKTAVGSLKISSIAAGDHKKAEESPEAELDAVMMERPQVEETLFDLRDGKPGMILANGRYYALLKGSLDAGQMGETILTVEDSVEDIALRPAVSGSEVISDVVPAGAKIRTLAGISEGTAVACEVDGKPRIFERVSYAAVGPVGETFEQTFSVADKIVSLEIPGEVLLMGDKAKEAIRIAYSHAQLDAQDKLAGDTRIIVTLENGISLQLTTNGTQLIGCGAWNCPEFFKFLDENGRK